MRKLICVLLCAAMIFGAVPAWAADNTVKLTGEGFLLIPTPKAQFGLTKRAAR